MCLVPSHLVMTPRLKALLTAVSATAVVTGVWAVSTTSLWPSIGGYAGAFFWVVLVALGSSSSVRMPGGTVVDVGIAPLLATAVLGGPAAAAVASAIGVFELRELRGLLPRGRRERSLQA